MIGIHHKHSVRHIMSVSLSASECSKYIMDNKPWGGSYSESDYSTSVYSNISSSPMDCSSKLDETSSLCSSNSSTSRISHLFLTSAAAATSSLDITIQRSPSSIRLEAAFEDLHQQAAHLSTIQHPEVAQRQTCQHPQKTPANHRSTSEARTFQIRQL